MWLEFQFCVSYFLFFENLRFNVVRSNGYKVVLCVIFFVLNDFIGVLMFNIIWCDLFEDVFLWLGLFFLLSGDEVMLLDYYVGCSGWLLYGCGLDK